jgi:uncharacterized protein (DUF2252 family)
MSMTALSIAGSDDGGNTNTIKNNKDDVALIQQRLLVLLPKQYNHLQDYCNAQIALENAWQLSQQSKQQYKSSDLLQAVAALQKETRRVQEDFQSLETMVLALLPSTSTATKEQLQQVQSSSASKNSIADDNDTTPNTRNRQRRHANIVTAAGRNSHQFQWQVQAEQHLQRTRRILHNLQTPTGQTSTSGIPLPTSATKQEDTIVALATLRASVAQLQSVLEASKDAAV